MTRLRSGKSKAKPSIDKTRRVLSLQLCCAAQRGIVATAPIPEAALRSDGSRKEGRLARSEGGAGPGRAACSRRVLPSWQWVLDQRESEGASFNYPRSLRAEREIVAQTQFPEAAPATTETRRADPKEGMDRPWGLLSLKQT